MPKSTVNTFESNVFDSIVVDKITSFNTFIELDKNVKVNGDLLPASDSSFNIGDSSLKWNAIIGRYSMGDTDLNGTRFTVPNVASSAAGVTTILPLSITNTPYVGSSNSFAFPMKGYYLLSFETKFDLGFLSNRLDIYLYLSTAGSTQATHQINSEEGRGMPVMVNFGFWVNDLSDRFQIRIKSVDGITNFKVDFGRMILCAGNY